MDNLDELDMPHIPKYPTHTFILTEEEYCECTFNRIWVTENGTHIPVQEMTLSHIQNCRRIIINEQWRVEWLAIFEVELLRRDIEKFII